MTLLLVAVQLAANLSTTSSIAAAGHDAIRRVASRAVDHHDPASVRRAMRDAEAAVVAQVSEGVEPTFRWRIEDRRVVLTITARNPRVAPSVLTAAVGLDHVDRTFSAPLEVRW